MFRSLTLVPAMLCVAAIAAAQTPTPAAPAAPASPDRPAAQQPATPPARPADSSMSASAVTYTGCLKPGATPGTWILDSAELAKSMGAGSASAATPGAGAVGTSGVTKSTFTLNTKPDAPDLKPHANHKIEVTGTVAAAKASASASPAGATASATPAGKDFAVESFKMVSTTCP
jgi:hypothetical protein